MRPSGKMPGCAPTREVRPFDRRGRRAPRYGTCRLCLVTPRRGCIVSHHVGASAAARRNCEAKGGAVERAAIWQDARLRADQGGPALRSPRAAGADMAPAAYG